MPAVGFLSLLLAASAPARAALVYENGDFGKRSGAVILRAPYEVTSSFVVSSSTTLTSAEFLLLVAEGKTPETVVWRIGTSEFGDEVATGTATMTLEPAGSTPLGDDPYDIYRASLAIDGAVASGVTYWLTLARVALSGGGLSYWGLSWTGTSEAYYRDPDYPSTPLSSSSPMFRLSDDPAAIPEPGSLTLLGLGVGCGLLVYRRRK